MRTCVPVCFVCAGACVCMFPTHEIQLWVLLLRCQPPLMLWSYFYFEVGPLIRLGLSRWYSPVTSSQHWDYVCTPLMCISSWCLNSGPHDHTISKIPPTELSPQSLKPPCLRTRGDEVIKRSVNPKHVSLENVAKKLPLSSGAVVRIPKF